MELTREEREERFRLTEEELHRHEPFGCLTYFVIDFLRFRPGVRQITGEHVREKLVFHTVDLDAAHVEVYRGAHEEFRRYVVTLEPQRVDDISVRRDDDRGICSEIVLMYRGACAKFVVRENLVRKKDAESGFVASWMRKASCGLSR